MGGDGTRLTINWCSEETDTAHDQIPLCPFYFWQGEIQSAKWALNLRPRVWPQNSSSHMSLNRVFTGEM